jgi:hypothetical protein
MGNWTRKTGTVYIDRHLRWWLDTIAKPLSFDIVVTSGIRTPKQQALVMFSKIDRGQNLLAIYRDNEFAQSVIDVYPNLEEATEIINQYKLAGKGSSHLHGSGLDIRTKDLSMTQQQELYEQLESLEGVYPLDEDDHYHVTVPTNQEYLDTEYGYSEQTDEELEPKPSMYPPKKKWLIWLGAGALVLALFKKG